MSLPSRECSLGTKQKISAINSIQCDKSVYLNVFTVNKRVGCCLLQDERGLEHIATWLGLTSYITHGNAVTCIP